MLGQGTMRAAVGTALLVIGVVAAYLLIRDASEIEGEPSASVTDGERSARDRPRKRPPSPAFGFEDEDVDVSIDATLEAPHFDLGQLDFEALRERAPNSLYWLLAAPTDDPAVLEARRAEKARRNEQYGRVLSGEASVEEIEDYYAYRRRLSEDYVEVAQLILDTHGDEMSERDVGLFELTIALHGSRLSELPQKLDDALRRKTEYDEVKRAWQAQQAAELEERAGDTHSSPN